MSQVEHLSTLIHDAFRNLDEMDRALITYRRERRGGAGDLRIDAVQADAFELRRDLCELWDGVRKLNTGEERRRPTSQREAYERFLELVAIAREAETHA